LNATELEHLHAVATAFMQQQQGVLEQVLTVIDGYLEPGV
jgi:hypothetical protein